MTKFSDTIKPGGNSIFGTSGSAKYHSIQDGADIYNDFEKIKHGKSYEDMDDPAIIGFTMVFDFSYLSPLLADVDTYHSALLAGDYLDSKGSVSSIIEQSLADKKSKLGNFGELLIVSNGPISGDYYHATPTSNSQGVGYSAADYLYMREAHVINRTPNDSFSSDTILGGSNVNDIQTPENSQDKQLQSALDSKKELEVKYETSLGLKTTAEADITYWESDDWQTLPEDQQAKYKNSNYESSLRNIIETQTTELDRISLEIDEANIKIAELGGSESLLKSKESHPTPSDETKADSTPDTHPPAPLSVLNLIRFGEDLKNLSERHSYNFQSIEGLDVAYSKYFDVSSSVKSSGDDMITVQCLENVGLSVSGMFNRYLNATYDRQYKRERIPLNLRRFNLTIYVHDIRNFRNLLSATGQALTQFLNDTQLRASRVINTTGNGSLSEQVTEMLANHLSVVEFNFFDCEFKNTDSGNIFSTISNAQSTEATTKFSFTYGDCVVNFVPHKDLVQAFNVLNVATDDIGSIISSQPDEPRTGGMPNENILETEMKGEKATRVINSLVGYGLRAVSNNNRSVYGMADMSTKRKETEKISNDENISDHS